MEPRNLSIDVDDKIMKILLLGEYSNVHATLAIGLRALGHKVTVASNGDFWKDYPRDISLVRHPRRLGGILLWLKLRLLLPRFRGYDVVQIINPMFVELKAERIFAIYDYLRRHNKRVFMGAYGMDYYWVDGCLNRRLLRYSDFNLGDEIRTNADAIKERCDWLGTTKERLNRYIAQDCDGIIAGLYEYWACYREYFPTKTTFIPFPINLDETDSSSSLNSPSPLNSTSPFGSQDSVLKIFIGISKSRSEYKGTDIMLRAAQAIASKYPEKVKIIVAEGVPFAQYQTMMNGSDMLLDQLYSYTPAMNALLAMSKGIVVVGGGEPENYEIINEKELRPIINVEPSEESVFGALEQLVLHPERIPVLKQQSIEYVRRHHDASRVAAEYEKLYSTPLLSCPS